MKSHLNIIVLTREYPVPIAGTKRVQHLLEELTTKNTSVKVLSIRSENKIENEKGLYNNVVYERIGSEVKIDITHLPSIFFIYLKVFIEIKRSKKKYIKNIIYSYGGVNIENILYILFAKLIGYKIIFDIVEDYTAFSDQIKIISRFKFWTVSKFDNLNIKFSDGIIVISTFLFDKYKKLNSRNLTLIPITAKIPKGLKLKEIQKEKFIVLYAGTFGDKDGIDLIINGFIEFSQIATNSILYLLGSSNQQKKYQYKYSQRHNIVFTGFISDEEFYTLIQRANVLCMCRTGSKFANAGFPFKLGEYLATGNPVIATKISDVEKYLTKNDAYLIEPDNQMQFINTLIDIYNNPEKAKIIGYNGKVICKNMFSPQKNSLILYNLLNSI